MSHVSYSPIKAKIISPNLLSALSALPLPLNGGVLRKTLFFLPAANKNGAEEHSHSLDWLPESAKNIRLIGCC